MFCCYPLKEEVYYMDTANNKSLYIKWAISIAIGLIFLIIPEQGVYTMTVKVFLCITGIGLALCAFELVSILAIGVLMPILWLAFGVAPAATIYSGWLGSTVPMVVGALFMANSLEDSGVLRRFSFWMLTKLKGGYLITLFAIVLTTAFLNVFTGGRGYLVMAPLALGLVMALNLKGTRAAAAIGFAVMVGGCTSHTFTYQATAWGVIMKAGEGFINTSMINPATLFIHNWPMLLVCLLIVFVASKWYKPEGEFGNTTYMQEQLAAMGKMSRTEKWNAVMVALVILYTFTVNIHNLDLNYGFAIIPWMTLLPGINAADTNTIKKVNLDIIFFFTACLGIGTVAASLGVGQAIANVIQALLAGNTSPFLVLAIVFGIVFILNFAMTPVAIFALITVPMLTLATSMGFNPQAFAYAISACSEAIILPYEYLPYLVIFAFGMMSMSDFIKLNIMRSVIVFASILFILVPYWMVTGLLYA